MGNIVLIATATATAQQPQQYQHSQSNSSSGSNDLSDSFRVYAHCTAGAHNGSVTLALLNFAADTATVVSLPARVEYCLTSDALTSPLVFLNGAQLRAGADGSLPPLPGRAVSDSSEFVMPPHTYAFVVLPDAAVSACMG